MPQQALSLLAITGPYVHGDTHEVQLLVDHEPGGVAINDASQGLFGWMWTLQMDGDDVVVSEPTAGSTVLFTMPNLTELSLAFDQNMKPVVAYVAAGTAFLWWFDTLTAAHIHTEIPGASSPRVTLDDKRNMQTGASDVILAYLVGTTLYFRAQRDRYLTAYQLNTDITRPLRKIAMNNKLRLQFEFGPAT